MTGAGFTQLVVFAALAVLTATWSAGLRHRLRCAAALFIVLAAGMVAASAAWLRRPRLVEAAPPFPASLAAGWVTSDACRACHPGEHASFGRTFHRTMTQSASTRSVLGRLDEDLDLDGAPFALTSGEGETVWARVPGDGEGRQLRRLSMTTGSHREQAFWMESADGSPAELFPFVWMARERRYVARRDVFITPPGVPLPRVRWSSSCIACHAVAGEPGRDPASGRFETRVAELGIACEACHGPGRAHVTRHRDPVERALMSWAGNARRPPDPTIVHPKKLTPERSLAVCGQCHGYAFPRDERAFWQTGYARAFRAGDELAPSRILIDPATVTGRDEVVIEADVDSIFWPDGSVRVGGREHGDVVGSACFFRGKGDAKLTCLSCHAMHEGDPEGQLAPDRTSDAACGACHDLDRARTHTHHAPGSPGSACASCHMPRTTYALLAATRSHRVAIPTIEEGGKPDACSLCHLDRPLAWTARAMEGWYGKSVPLASADAESVPEGLRRAATGDAAVRAIFADAFGRGDAARAGVTGGFRRAVLEELAADPYGAVRFIAERGLARTPDRAEGLDAATWSRLVETRDTRPVTISE